jgi:hypothetical protein
MLEGHDEAHCMGCRKGWDKGILATLMTQSFLSNKYKKHRKDTLLDMEKSLLPQTQPDVERTIVTRRNRDLLSVLTLRKAALYTEIRNITDSMNDIRYAGNMSNVYGVDGDVTTRKCPVEDCRGFLGKNWMCGICETQICKECNEKKEEGHECDQNNIDTMKLLKKDSKPCPSCGVLITKIDGCDQMWCTQPSCHTAFSWRTGKKVFGMIHNPHFVQFSMQNGVVDRNPLDLPCGGLPHLGEYFENIRKYNQTMFGDNLDIAKSFMQPIGAMRHILAVEVPHYNVTEVRDVNTDLRVRYLMNEIDEEAMATTVINRNTAREKKKAFHDIVVMTLHTGTDIINMINSLLQTRHIKTPYNAKDIGTQVMTMKKLREYANVQFKRVGDLYNCKYPRIDTEWEFIRFWPLPLKPLPIK